MTKSKTEKNIEWLLSLDDPALKNVHPGFLLEAIKELYDRVEKLEKK